MKMPVKAKRTLGFCPEGSFGGRGYPFDQLFDKVIDVRKEGLDDIDCLILWGGTDIHPSLYGQTPSVKCYAPHLPSDRDVFEWSCLKYCKINDIPTIGVCRGAQMQCAFAGGTLAQHVTGHNGGDHMVQLSDGTQFLVSSVHHQMMNPFTNKVPHELLAWAAPARSEVYVGQDEKDIREMKLHVEPEIVWFPEIRGLAIQGHPEYNVKGTQLFVNQCVNYVREYIFQEVAKELS
jgi:anthranilate/para-aminobenzoate synthase component II